MIKLIATKAEPTLKTLEGYRDSAYQPVPGDPWTCGYGTTRRWFNKDTTCTEDLAEDWLAEDIDAVIRGLQNLVEVPLTSWQADALIILCYNIGVRAFGKSNALKLLNSGDYDGCATACFDPIKGFVRAHGIIVQGLVNRRQLELNIWNGNST